MKQILPLLLCLFTIALQAQPFSIGHVSINFKDASRSGGYSINGGTTFPSGGTGRTIGTEVYYPATSTGDNTPLAAGTFPVVVFGHGFAMGWDSYPTLYDSLARNGFIVALARTEGSLLPAPSHLDFGKDLAFIAAQFISMNATQGNTFYQKVNGREAIGGHSMGGGATFLSDAYAGNNVKCYFTFAAAETNPSCIAVANAITRPHLVFSGTYDCVAPPATNQDLMYDTLGAACKTQINLIKGYHCTFADYNFNCGFGEGTCITAGGLSSALQQQYVRMYLNQYLDYYLKGDCNAWIRFQQLVDTATVATIKQSCNNLVPLNAAITGSNTVCTGGNTTLTATPVGFNYTWNDNSTGNTLNVTQAGSYTLTVSNGVCALTSAPFTVAQASIPNTPLAITSADTVCSGISNIVLSTSPDAAATYYVWTLPQGWSVLQNDSTSSITVLSGNAGGTIQVSAANSCGVSTAVNTNIVVVPSNLGTPGVITGDTVTCSGNTLSFSILPVAGAESYIWNYPNGWQTSSTLDSTNFEATAQSLSGLVTVNAINNCGQSAASSIYVQVGTAATLTGNIAGPGVLCSTTDTLLTFTASGTGTFNWAYPNTWTAVGSTTDSTLTVIANSSGAVSVNTSNTCGNSATINTTIQIVPLPQATITVSNDTLYGPAAVSYQWYLNGNAISGATGSYYVPTQTGNYSLQVFNQQGCNNQSAGLAYTYNSLMEAELSTINVFPNPTNGQLFVQNKNGVNCMAFVYSTQGALLLQQPVQGNTILLLNQLSNGVYLLAISSKGNTVYHKIILAK